MAPRRSTAKRKIDQCSYVKQLFANFLDRNQHKHTVIPTVRPKPIQRPLRCFPIDNEGKNNIFRQQVLHNFRKAQGDGNGSKIVGDFFAKPDPKVDLKRDSGELQQACFARFKRHEDTNLFIRREPSPGAPVQSLARWIEVRKRAQIEQHLMDQQNKKKRKEEEYLNLSENFLSGRDAMKLPFETASVGDRTMVSVGSKFVPPATSTPFDGEPIEPFSPIVSDPDELVQRSVRKVKENSEEFLEKVASMMERFNATLCESDNAPLDRDFIDLQQFRHQKAGMSANVVFPRNSFAERSSWMDHSLYSNANYQPREKQAPSSLFDATNTSTAIGLRYECDRISTQVHTAEPTLDSFQQEILRPLPLINNTSDDDPLIQLLTASPPSPSRMMSQTLREELAALEDQMRTKQGCNTSHSDFDFDAIEESFTFISQQNPQSGNDFFGLNTGKAQNTFELCPPVEHEVRKYNLSFDESVFATQKNGNNQSFDFLDIFS